jgi:hypothetical protein
MIALSMPMDLRPQWRLLAQSPAILPGARGRHVLFERDNARVWVPAIGSIRMDSFRMKIRTETRPSHAGGGLLRRPGALQGPLIPIAVLQGQQNL